MKEEIEEIRSLMRSATGEKEKDECQKALILLQEAYTLRLLPGAVRSRRDKIQNIDPITEWGREAKLISSIAMGEIGNAFAA